MWKRRSQEVPSAADFFTHSMTQLKKWQAHRNAFYNDFARCQKIKLVINNAGTMYYVYFYFTRSIPFLVGTNVGGAHYSSYYYNVDWTLVGETQVAYIDYVQEVVDFLNSYYNFNYTIDLFENFSGTRRPWVSLVDTDNASLTIEQIYRKFCAWMKYEKETGEIESDGAREMLSRSEQEWPDTPGLATRYIDNVGVYLPDWLDVDYNLSHKLGIDLVGCNAIRVPSNEAEAQLFKAQFWGNFLETWLMPGSGSISSSLLGTGQENAPSRQAASGIAEGALDTYATIRQGFSAVQKNIRAVYPRFRAFGRQTVNVVNSATVINARLKSLENNHFVLNGREVSLIDSKYVFWTTQEVVDNFLQAVTSGKPLVEAGEPNNYVDSPPRKPSEFGASLTDTGGGGLLT